MVSQGAEATAKNDGYLGYIVARNAYLKKYWAAKKRRDAARFADAWREQYPGKPVPKMLESYEISEYGRPPIESDFDLLMG